MPYNLIKYAYDSDVYVEYWDLVYPLMAAYIRQAETPPVIVISNKLFNINNRPLFRVILAEELGHHFLTVGDTIPREHHSYHHRICFSKEEFKARRWAAHHLIPDINLKKVLLSGIKDVKELSRYFEVTEKFMDFRLNLLKTPKMGYENDNFSIFLKEKCYQY